MVEFSLDEGWDTSPITPRVVSDVFADLGTNGLASWRPFEGTIVAVAALHERVVSTPSTVRDVAESVASRTGAELLRRQIGSDADGGYIEAAPHHNAGASTRRVRSLGVFPALLEGLNADP